MLRLNASDTALAGRMGMTPEEMAEHLMRARIERAKAIADTFRAIKRGVASLFAGLADARRRRAAYAELNSLDDRMLRDMGLSRGELWSAVDGTARPAASNDNGKAIAANDDAPRPAAEPALKRGA